MRILLSNDDGIGSPGLAALGLALAAEHEVWVVAPDRDRSGCSHSITVGLPVVITQTGERLFACGGTPVDCVNMALSRILPALPDIVVSGINLGANLGTDLLYSGTAAAARHAALEGLPAIAVSMAGSPPWRPEPSAAFVAANLEVARALCPAGSMRFVNINVPNGARGPLTARAAAPAQTRYVADGESFRAPTGETYHFYRVSLDASAAREDSDFEVVRSGAVAVTLIDVYPSHDASLDAGLFHRT